MDLEELPLGPTVLMTVVLGLLTAVFSPSLWNELGILDASAVVGLTSLLTVTVTLMGFLISFHGVLHRAHSKMFELSPDQGGIVRYSGDQALKIVANRLGEIKKVKNTRIISPDYRGELYDQGTAIWNEMIEKHVRTSDIVFYDIVSGKGVEATDGLVKKLRGFKKRRGSYERRSLDFEFKSFLNFKVLYYKNGETEIWFGWKITHLDGIDEDCFRSTNAELIRMFESWHDDLSDQTPENGLEQIPSK